MDRSSCRKPQVWLCAALLPLIGGCLQPGLRGPGSAFSTARDGRVSAVDTNLVGGELAESFDLPRGQLLIHSNFYLPPTHPLIEDVVALRADIFGVLGGEPGTEPIHVHLFRSPEDLARIVQQTGDPILQRRAYFLQTAHHLRVYASWTYDIGIDLRHELTHGYLHSVRPNIPLWLDEGLAEYFETPRAERGRHADHLAHLAELHRSGKLNLDLDRLEQSRDPASFEQRDYAMSWLWVAFLLSHPDKSDVLAQYFRDLPTEGSNFPSLSSQLKQRWPDLQQRVSEFLEQRIRPGGAGVVVPGRTDS